jgi:hypothetical protein
MAPQEVAGLQALAKAHGGSLTTNPDTGLPEAGFLSSILPTLIGGGLSIASGGALTPLMAMGLVGGGVGLASGSLRKGLTAGLGAYGGAGLGSALAGSGSLQGLMAGDAASQAAMGVDANAKDLLLARGAETSAPGMFGNAAKNFSNAGAGLTSLGGEAGRNAFMGQIGGNTGLMKAGMMAAAPMLAAPVTKQPEIKSDADMGQRFKFSPGRVGPTPMPDTPGQGSTGQNFGRERTYFAPTYTPIGQEEATNAYGFAAGGPVENMSNLNTVGANTGYPQSDITPRAYATPFQQPMPQNVVGGVQGAGINPYTGQEQFAEGGEVGADEYTFDPVTQTYTKKGGQGATTVKPPSMVAGTMGDSYTPFRSAFEDMTDDQKAAHFRDSPIQAAITRTGLDFFAPTMYGRFQDYMMPGFQQNLRTLTYGYTPADVNANAARMESMQNALNEDVEAARGYTYQGTDPIGTGMSYDSDREGGGGSGSTDNGDSGRDHGNSGSAPGGGAANGGLMALAGGGAAQYNLGGYSDGGRLLRGPGDGVSDSIPAMIGNKQPARLADGEFVVPARIVSELGNGSTEAGARKLYAMMDRVQKTRKKSMGKDKVATDSKAHRLLPA